MDKCPCFGFVDPWKDQSDIFVSRQSYSELGWARKERESWVWIIPFPSAHQRNEATTSLVVCEV